MTEVARRIIADYHEFAHPIPMEPLFVLLAAGTLPDAAFQARGQRFPTLIFHAIICQVFKLFAKAFLSRKRYSGERKPPRRQALVASDARFLCAAGQARRGAPLPARAFSQLASGRSAAPLVGPIVPGSASAGPRPGRVQEPRRGLALHARHAAQRVRSRPGPPAEHPPGSRQPAGTRTNPRQTRAKPAPNPQRVQRAAALPDGGGAGAVR